jgi:hypothetical protein
VIQEQIDYVEAFLIDEYDICVDFSDWGMDEYWFDPDDPEDSGVVSINSTHSPIVQLVILLHEAGHIVFRKKNNKVPEHIDRETITGRMEVIHEEIMAWYEGRNLSKQLGIKIEKEMWEESYCDSLLKYIKWVLDETDKD